MVFDIKRSCYWYDEECDMGGHIPWCKCKDIFPLESCEGCEEYHNRTEPTNADRVRSMTDDQLEEWFWWMVDYLKWFTDSRHALHDWLKEEEKRDIRRIKRRG